MTVVSTDSKLAVTEFEKGSKEILDELMEIVETKWLMFLSRVAKSWCLTEKL